MENQEENKHTAEEGQTDEHKTHMVKLGTFNAYTPHGNSYDEEDNKLNYNVDEDHSTKDSDD